MFETFLTFQSQKKIWFSKIKVNLENPLQFFLTSGSNKYSLFTFWVWIFFLFWSNFYSFRQNHETKFRCYFNFYVRFPNISVSSCHKEEQTGKYCDPGGFFPKVLQLHCGKCSGLVSQGRNNNKILPLLLLHQFSSIWGIFFILNSFPHQLQKSKTNKKFGYFVYPDV